MLGTLAKWLRIYGFDTFYATNNLDDSDILDMAKTEKRILISRDKRLIQNARKENIKIVELKTTDIDEQIRKVITDYPVDKNKFLSRCIICNSKVEDIDKNKVKDKIPDRIFINKEKFWFCKKCNKIYWKGSHYENMIKKMDFLR